VRDVRDVTEKSGESEKREVREVKGVRRARERVWQLRCCAFVSHCRYSSVWFINAFRRFRTQVDGGFYESL